LYPFGKYRGLEDIMDSLFYLDKYLLAPNNDN
jgi:hypothetical protein